MAAASDTRRARMVVTTDWDAGFRLTPEAKPLDDVQPGGEYVVECTAQRDVVLEDVTIRDFVLDRLYVGTLFANTIVDEGLVATGSVDDRRYRLDPPISVAKTTDIRAVLKNATDVAKKPKIAVLLGTGESVDAALKDWLVTGVHVGRAAKPIAPSCPTCDSPDREIRRMIDGATASCRDAWHGESPTLSEPEKVVAHVPKIARTLYDGPGNATLVSGCSCGAETLSPKAFADHVGMPEHALVAMLGLVGVIYDLCDFPAQVTREEAAKRVARCLEFTR